MKAEQFYVGFMIDQDRASGLELLAESLRLSRSEAARRLLPTRSQVEKFLENRDRQAECLASAIWQG